MSRADEVGIALIAFFSWVTGFATAMAIVSGRRDA